MTAAPTLLVEMVVMGVGMDRSGLQTVIVGVEGCCDEDEREYD